ncbi:hypothetical protein QF037_004466 [Streptomyces canus]|nr:hypothetical protein [Streptomyces canus]
MRDAAGVGALYAPGRRCPPGRRETSARRLPPHSGPPFTPLLHPTGGGFSHETSSRVHWCSPVRPSPCLSPPGGTEVLGLLPGASHPAVASDARPGEDGSSDTNPGLPCHRRHRRPPLQEHPLNTRDLVSHTHLESASDGRGNEGLDNPHSRWSGALSALGATRRTTCSGNSARLATRIPPHDGDEANDPDRTPGPVLYRAGDLITASIDGHATATGEYPKGVRPLHLRGASLLAPNRTLGKPRCRWSGVLLAAVIKPWTARFVKARG